MKRRIKKILSYLPAFLSEYFEWIFSDASENQIRIAKSKKNKFRSYTQLKKHQKKLKIFVAGFFLALFFLWIGLVVGPTLFPKQIETELYIPNGRGDILLGNVSKNQATVIFKTLDSANGNKPLATKAFVEVFDDKDYTKLVRRSAEDDYAITHIIPVDSLQEGNIYYIRITAKDAANPAHMKNVSFWGDGKDPIRVYTTGELIPSCAVPKETPYVAAVNDNDVSTGKNEKTAVQITTSIDSTTNAGNAKDLQQSDDSVLHISNVMNENYLQPKNKVQTIISWNTNIPATTVLIYSEGNSKEKKEIIINDQLQTKHAAILTTLKAGTTYYFNVKSVDENGGVAISEEYSLRTPKPQSTVTEKIFESFKSIFRQVKPN